MMLRWAKPKSRRDPRDAAHRDAAFISHPRRGPAGRMLDSRRARQTAKEGCPPGSILQRATLARSRGSIESARTETARTDAARRGVLIDRAGPP